MAQAQTASFQGVPIVGLDFPLRRGTGPSTGRIRIPQIGDLSASSGELIIQAGDTVTFSDVVPDLSTLRYLNRDGKREWVMRIQDRRARWPSARISGHYNRRYRDGTIDSDTESTASELADAAMAAVSESAGASLADAKPEVDWDSTPVNEALDELAKYLPIHVVRTKDDAYTLVKTGQGEKVSDYTSTPAITPFFQASFDGGPETIRAICAKTWYACKLSLKAVGLELDGSYVPIDDLSYKPSFGWEKEWPTLFSGVSQGYRPRAFQSVFRCYQVEVPQTLPLDDDEGSPIELTSLDDIDLDYRRLISGEYEPPLSLVAGTWWPYTDHYYNTANCLIYGNEHWRFDKEHRMIVFDYPIFKAGTCVEEADIDLYTSFHLRDPATLKWRRKEFTVSRTGGSGEWSLSLPFLWAADGIAYTDCAQTGTFDNSATLESEVQVYLDAWKDHFDTVKDKMDVPFVGARRMDLSGNIAQLKYRIGRGLTPETRASQHYIPTM